MPIIWVCMEFHGHAKNVGKLDCNRNLILRKWHISLIIQWFQGFNEIISPMSTPRARAIFFLKTWYSYAHLYEF